MLAIELVRTMLGFGAFALVILGTLFVFDPLPNEHEAEKGNFLVLIALIFLTIMFHI